MSAAIRLAAISAFSLFAAATACAQQPVKVCPLAEIRSVSVSPEFTADSFRDGKPEIQFMPAAMVLLGPVLGSMDSQELKPVVTCTEKGIAVTIVLTRSADYAGAAAKNAIWRPRIEVVFARPATGSVVEVKWTMRLSTGAQVDRARTPPFRQQSYPITVSRTIPERV